MVKEYYRTYPKFVFDLPTKISSTFQDKITTYLIEKVTESWYFYFGLLKQYYKKFGTSLVPHKYKYNDLLLGRWVARQREAFNRDESSKEPKLSKEKSDLLKKTFSDWSWDPIEDIWWKNFEALREY